MVFIIINKVRNFVYTLLIRKKYNLSTNINIRGKVYLDNPNIVFGNNVTLYAGVQVWGNAPITIGNNVAIGKDTIIYANMPLNIGNDTIIAAQCYIIDSDHGYDKSLLIRKQSLKTESILIGNDVWIGAGSTILKGSKISDGAVIGAMGLVNNFVEPYSINVGIPVRKVNERN